MAMVTSRNLAPAEMRRLERGASIVAAVSVLIFVAVCTAVGALMTILSYVLETTIWSRTLFVASGFPIAVLLGTKASHRYKKSRIRTLATELVGRSPS